MVAIDRDEFVRDGHPDVLEGIKRYILVGKLALERKTLKELKGEA